MSASYCPVHGQLEWGQVTYENNNIVLGQPGVELLFSYSFIMGTVNQTSRQVNNERALVWEKGPGKFGVCPVCIK